MKALVLNSGLGSRMGELTATLPKAMLELSEGETVIGRQLRQLQEAGIRDIVVTTGPFENVLIAYVKDLFPTLNFTFVRNELYEKTNYIYSIYLARDELDDDLVLMHGDLVIQDGIIEEMLASDRSLVTVSTTMPVPVKDFKGVMDEDMLVKKIGVEYFDTAVALQPLYVLKKEDWLVWLKEIISFCKRGETSCYAEKAFNEISDQIQLKGFDFKGKLCNEIDDLNDLEHVRQVLKGKNK